MLTVLDEFTRQALAVKVRTKMGADDVLEALYPLLLSHGVPEYIRSDNGPEFAAEELQHWLRRVGIKPIRIHPGSPLSAIASNRLPGQRMGERIQRTLQRNTASRGSERGMVHNHRAGADRHQSLAQTVQSHPTASGPQYAPASARNLIRETANYRPSNRGLD
ncbi:MAG: DDE-type integrase/transposase/recombinase, partial [Pseudomonadota bacterium]